MTIALPPPNNSKRERGLFARLRQTPLRDLLRGRLTGRLDWQRKLAASGLPPAARIRIFETVKRTKLWRLEKAEVCDELMAHFEDGILAGESAEALARDFGDPVRTAKLIRRAKKKLRPLWWHGWKWTLRGLAALVIVYAGLTVYYMNDKVTIKTDYLAQLNAVALNTPESERAWPMYRKAIMEWPELWDGKTEWDEIEGEQKPPLFAALNARGLTDITPGTPAWKIVEYELEAHQKQIEAFRQGAFKPSFGVIAYQDGDYAAEDIPFYFHGKYAQYAPSAAKAYLRKTGIVDISEGSHSRLGYLYMRQPHDVSVCVVPVLRMDMRTALSQHDHERFMKDAQALFGVINQMNGLAGRANLYYGHDLRQQTFDEIGSSLSQHPEEFSISMLHTLATLADQDRSPLLDMQSAREYVNDILQSCYTDDGHGNGHLAINLRQVLQMTGEPQDMGLGFLASPALRPVICLFSASRKDMEKLADDYFSQAEPLAKTPLWENPDDTFTLRWQMHHPLLGAHSWNLDTLRYPLAFCISPILAHYRPMLARTAATHSALSLGIALHRHRLAHGAFPAQLSDLVPAYLKELPVDPITGGPLHYRLDAKGNPVVWSVGADHADDGGYAPVNRAGEADNDHAQRWLAPEDLKTAAKGDWILWPMSDLPVMAEK